MKARTRLIVTGIFAIVGAVASAILIPSLLDELFTKLQGPSTAIAQAAADPSIGNSLKDGKNTAPKSGSETKEPTVKANPPDKQTPGGEVGKAKTPEGDHTTPTIAKPDDSGKGSGKSEAKDPDTSTPQRRNDQREKSLENASQPDKPEHYPGRSNPLNMVAIVLLGLIVGGGFGNALCNGVEHTTRKWDKMDIGDKVTLFVGIFAGILASLPFSFALLPLGGFIMPVVTLGLTVGFSALGVLALRSMEEVLPWQKGQGKGRKSGLKILDTNVIIDGRIYDLARTGFLEGRLYIPQFVLNELQHIADSADSLRRQRGRRGLDVLRLMKNDFEIEVGTQDRLAGPPNEEVDSRLVKLAKALGGDIVSNDFNLNRVATLQQVRVLNVNDLALALRPNVLPGEGLEVTVIREGNQMGQGVAYLEDGTMVVVEQGRKYINETLMVNVTQVIQTERGKMIFAEAPDDNPEIGEVSPKPRKSVRENRP